MIKKHDTNKEVINRTDELINDYLQDVFSCVGESERAETVPISTFFQEKSFDKAYLNKAVEESCGTQVCDEVLTQCNTLILPVHVPIQHNCFLVPTLKLLSSNAGNECYSQARAILILLNALYFLRRPLSPRVRQCFLSLSEQMIDDYQFASFKQQMARQGVSA